MIKSIAALAAALCIPLSVAAQSPGATTKIGVLAGPGDGGHGSQNFYGTDLGITYKHDGTLHILFGDSWADAASGTLSGTTHDDVFGTLAPLTGNAAEASPPTALLAASGNDPLTSNPSMTHADLGKTPLAAFSNGTDQYIIYHSTKPQGCRYDSQCDEGLTCDRGLGYLLNPWDDDEGWTLPCIDGTLFCNNSTMTNAWGWPVASGFCRDATSSRYQPNASGRVASVAVRHRVGVRQGANSRDWAAIEWVTNKFANVTARVGEIDGVERVLLWGRPGFAAVGATGRAADMYFAYADMPSGNPSFSWNVHYWTGSGWSNDQNDAEAIIENDVDIVGQTSVAFVDDLDKWVMLYGGDMPSLPVPGFALCGVLEANVGADCWLVDHRDGEILMRTASDPRGPWSAAEVVIAASDHDGADGMKLLHKPGCETPGVCAPHSPWPLYAGTNEYGVLYGVNIISEYTEPRTGSVDIYWNVSTWDPYNVTLLKTNIPIP